MDARDKPAHDELCSCSRTSLRRDNFLPLFASGKIKPLVDKVFALDELEAAKTYMESDRQTGKIVVRA